ncbi:MAG: aminotransferase class I/II-fold pyridoxal phosphate-dependent enzyme [Deltaproteobacteria bacterium]|jgi:aspartate aminotransferase|nr:aminotransferase class I/II-fold pyridoxal phosphate-dependent enzyme [Deltaproteobacteria bacterium]MBW2531202.1 aminotransferase class I/II-fold pyridoxal phosphate-dependent enzyme [Deltaproteobacteria bacterium]
MGRKQKHEVRLNLNVRGLKPSATLAINERSAALRAQGREVYRLGLGQSPFPVAAPVVEALRRHAHEKDYLPVKGLPALREAVAAYLRRSQHLSYTGDDVLVGPGSKELMFLLQLVYYGDLVIPTPSWVSYAPQAHIIGRTVRWVTTRAEDGWRLVPSELERICQDDPDRPRIVILNYPSNPTGRSYPIDELKALARVAREHRVVLVSDEIYGELHHRGQHVSVARFYPEGTIVSGGLSKWCGAGGWRLGVFAVPESLRWLLDALAAVASETFTSTAAPIQFAAVRAYEGGPEIERYLDHGRRLLRGLGRYCAAALGKVNISVPEPQGGFYLFPSFEPVAAQLAQRGVATSAALCEQLLEQAGVALLPGSDFGRPEQELTVRLAYVDFDGARALEAIDQLPRDAQVDEAFLREHCGPTVTGVQRICEWVERAPAG